MRKLGKRAWFVISLGLLAVPLVVTAVAYGCTAVATLATDPGAAPAGSTITVSGQGFGTHDPAAADTNGAAEIRLDSVTGPVLASASPAGAKRTFSVQISVPQVAPGDHFLTATQAGPDGTPVYGTPARQAFTVTAPAARTASAQSSSGLTATGPTTASSTKVKSKATVAKAVATCKKKYNPGKARSKKGKKRSAAKRAACIKKARA